jgi:hypothetical protein
MTDPTCPRTFVLRDLPLAARLTLAVFLISVGIGYLSALVQLHFQHASPGSLLPTPEDAEKIFSNPRGPKPKSKIELLIEADEKLPFNGQGEMSRAFTTRSEGWKTKIKEKAQELAGGKRRENPDLDAAEKALRQERNTERLAMVEWIRSGASKTEYKQDRYCLPDALAQQPMSEDYLVIEDGKPVEPRAVKIRSLLQDRCARCHSPGGEDAKAAEFPLHTLETLKPYVAVQTASAMSLTKLAQTTHVHLLGFSMLYGLTGLILAFSSYPRVLRVVLCPLPLLAQVADISLWWLARLEDPYGPMLARAIAVTGAVVGGSLFLHLVLGLWALFTWRGRFVLVLLFAAAGYGGYVAKEKVIDPYMAREATPAAQE